MDRPRRTSEMVAEFHRAFGLPIADAPTLAGPDLAQLRLDLLEEEVAELRDAVAAGDLVAIADALADITYVAHGSALSYGLPLDDLVAEVHRSNMSKLGPDGRPILRADGKALKGPDYRPPQLSPIVDAARRRA